MSSWTFLWVSSCCPQQTKTFKSRLIVYLVKYNCYCALNRGLDFKVINIMLYKFNSMLVLQENLEYFYMRDFFTRGTSTSHKKIMYIFILIQFFPTASSPNKQPSEKVIKLLVFLFMVPLLQVLLK